MTPTAIPLSEQVYARGVAAARAALARISNARAYLGVEVAPSTLSGIHPDEIAALSQGDPVGFARQYLAKNVVKCSFAAEIYKSLYRNQRRIIDLGTGPGSFLFAFASHLKSTEFVGIDRSAGALVLASELFRLAGLTPPLLLNGHVPSSIIDGGKFFSASYLLTELSESDRVAFYRWAIRRRDAQFMVVDYPEVAAHFAQAVGMFRPCRLQAARVRLPADIAEVVGDDVISFGTAFAASLTGRPAPVSGELAKPQHRPAHRLV